MAQIPSHFLSLLRTKITFNLKAEARRNQLSYAWWLLEPLFEATVFYVVFSIFLASGTENFVAFLLTGLIPYTWFSRSISNSMTSLRSATWALNNFRINPIFFPLVEIGQDSVKQLVTFSFLLAFLLLYGIEPQASWVYLPLIMLVQALLVTAVACFVASIIPLLEDLKYLVNTALMATMFASGIFYDAQLLITDEWRPIFFINPVASVIQMYRDILMFGSTPSLYNLLIVVLWIIGVGAIALFAISHYQKRYARLLLE